MKKKESEGKLLAALKKKKVKYYPKGGDVTADETEDLTQENIPSAEDIPQSAPETPAAPIVPQPTGGMQLPPAAVQGAELPPAGAQQVTQPVVSPAEDYANKKTLENMQFGDDIHKGLVEPKTYQSLYNDKSWPGKIGTLFGMLVSGAGSGLAHQPNAVLSMMDAQIQRDMEAQKQNQSNRLNWYNATLAHDKNQAEVSNLNARTGMIPSEIAQREALTQGTRISNVRESTKASAALNALRDSNPSPEDMKITDDSVASARMGTLGIMEDQVNRLPPGPQRDLFQNFIDNQARPFFTKKIYDDHLKTGVRLQNSGSFNPQPTQAVANGDNPVIAAARVQPFDEKGFFAKQIATKNKEARAANAGVPVTYTSADITDEQAREIQKEKKEGATLAASQSETLDPFIKLAAMPGGGEHPYLRAGAEAAGDLATGAAGAAGTVAAGPAGGLLAELGGEGFSKAIKGLSHAKLQELERERNNYISAITTNLKGLEDSAEARKALAYASSPGAFDSENNRREMFRLLQNAYQGRWNPSYLKTHGLYKPLPKVDYDSAVAYERKQRVDRESKEKDAEQMPASTTGSGEHAADTNIHDPRALINSDRGIADRWVK